MAVAGMPSLEQGSMKHIVNLHAGRQDQSESHFSNSLRNGEWTSPLWQQLSCSWAASGNMHCRQQDSLPYSKGVGSAHLISKSLLSLLCSVEVLPGRLQALLHLDKLLLSCRILPSAIWVSIMQLSNSGGSTRMLTRVEHKLCGVNLVEA